MKLINNSSNPLAHGGHKLPKGGIADIPDEIAKEWLKIRGIKQYVSGADLAEAKKEAGKEKAELLAKIEKLEADLAEAKKEKTPEPDLEALKEEAKALGIEFPSNIGAKALKAKIEAKKSE